MTTGALEPPPHLPLQLLIQYTVSIVVDVVCFPPSSLSSVTPPDIKFWYVLKLPQEVIDYCHLSALQLEAVVYACHYNMRHF